ncbi:MULTISPECIES: sigma factor-like helix-turn-helix DNA-binding protein [unclassified Kribbella]|uniref:sigma factor-like helix-turn-helix DNA-binding protein n=1 Tax=unclassified Kribbella TaxID=2644121 RepID=UPI003078751F
MVVLRYYTHLTDPQIASVLGVAVGTVKSRLSRAVKALEEDPGLAELRGTR